MRPIVRCLRIAWASPWSLLGLLLGLAALASGGRAQIRAGILEFCGGLVARGLRLMPIQGGAGALTLGHVVLGCSPAALDAARDHELVHVRQYERWGPFFIPAYAACSFLLWLRGGRPYLDNPFERQAYAQADGDPTPSGVC